VHGDDRGYVARRNIKRKLIAQTVENIHTVGPEVIGDTERTPEATAETGRRGETELHVMEGVYQIESRILFECRCIYI
jgi:hypothetical protein